MNKTNTMNIRASCNPSSIRDSVLSRRSSNYNRRQGRSNYQLPGAFFLPPSLLSKQSGEKSANRTHTDCIADALAILRSTKRRKHYDDDQEQQQKPPRHHDDSKPQTPVFHDQGDENSPIDPNESISKKRKKTFSSNACAHKDSFGVLSRRLTRKTKTSEWTIGILPPVPMDQQYTATRIPMLCSMQASLGTNLSFSTGLSTPTDIETQERRISPHYAMHTMTENRY